MRSLVLTAAMAAALPAMTQDAHGSWYLDVHQVSPTLEGNYQGLQDGKPVDFDLVKDLGVGKHGNSPGFGLEYQGPRFGVELSMESQKYLGSKFLTRPVTISGQTFQAQALVDSDIKLTNYTFNWTIRFMRQPGFWVGLDLGVRGTALDLHAKATNYMFNQVDSADFKSGLPMPQVGLSAGYSAMGGRLAGRAFYHYLGYKGAKYHNAGADLRYFPISWLGVRVFTDAESWTVPKDSFDKDLSVNLDRSGTGFGVVAKF